MAALGRRRTSDLATQQLHEFGQYRGDIGNHQMDVIGHHLERVDEHDAFRPGFGFGECVTEDLVDRRSGPQQELATDRPPRDEVRSTGEDTASLHALVVDRQRHVLQKVAKNMAGCRTVSVVRTLPVGLGCRWACPAGTATEAKRAPSEGAARSSCYDLPVSEQGPLPYADTMRAVLSGPGKSFVVFSHGTVVIFVDAASELDLAGAATDLMRSFGPVHAGSPAGDFGVTVLPDDHGFAVTSHHNDILTVVHRTELDDHGELAVGLLGRSKRGQDAEDLSVVHVKDNR